MDTGKPLPYLIIYNFLLNRINAFFKQDDYKLHSRKQESSNSFDLIIYLFYSIKKIVLQS